MNEEREAALRKLVAKWRKAATANARFAKKFYAEGNPRLGQYFSTKVELYRRHARDVVQILKKTS